MNYITKIFTIFIVSIFYSAQASDLGENKGNFACVALTTDPYELTIGEDSAPIVVVEYTSFSCGICAHFHLNILPQIKNQYIDKGLVRFVFRHFPTDRESLKAATIINEIPLIRRLDSINQVFFHQQDWIGPQLIEKLANICDLSIEKCKLYTSDSKRLDEALKHRQEIEQQAQIEGTPTFFINGKIYSTTLTFENFKDICNDIIKKKNIKLKTI